MVPRKAIALWLIAAFPSMTEGANWNPLPDTGQTKCYAADGNEITCPAEGEPFYGQDAQYYGAAPSYIDNNDGTVKDNNTKLIWQKNTADTNGDGNISADNHPAGDSMTWQEAVDYCAGLVFAGKSDWRLPDVTELDSIVDYEGVGMNPVFNYASGMYWSSDSPQGSPAVAWYVSFPSGHNYWPSKLEHNYVRCVADAM